MPAWSYLVSPQDLSFNGLLAVFIDKPQDVAQSSFESNSERPAFPVHAIQDTA